MFSLAASNSSGDKKLVQGGPSDTLCVELDKTGHNLQFFASRCRLLWKTENQQKDGRIVSKLAWPPLLLVPFAFKGLPRMFFFTRINFR
jgi:hypothetical protein